MAVPTSNISISSVNTEITSVNSTSLTTLSQNANTASIVASPHGLNEFSGYTHGPSNHTVGWTRNGPSGKISQYYSSAETGTSVPFGSNDWGGWVHGEGTNRFTLYWDTTRNDSWTSFTVGSSTITRSGASSTSTNSHIYLSVSNAFETALLGNTSGYFTYGP